MPSAAQDRPSTPSHGVAPPPAPTRPGRWSRLESLLLAEGLATEPLLLAARARRAGSCRPLPEVLVEEGVDATALLLAVAACSGLPIAGLADMDAAVDVQGLVDAQVVHRQGVLPLRLEGDALVVVTSDPFQLPLFDQLRDRLGKRVRVLVATPAQVREASARARPGEEALDNIVKNERSATAIQFEASSDAQGAPAPADDDGPIELRDVTGDGPVVRFVNLMVSDAIRQGASDIHVEPEQECLRVRLRIDGELREVQRVPKSVRQLVTSRIKVVAGLDLIETRRPQDGRARVDVNGQTFDLRVSTLPSFFGEKIVIRLLDRAARTFDLDRNGMDAGDLETWRGMLRRPNGLVLVTGPTGSGKTSTLYASLLELRSPAINVVTVEDPVEFQFPGIVQVPVRHDLDMGFANVLRSTLRQDPDVILVGEIRDAETAEVAMQAALTGHIVLSTLHTNDAVGAVSRMLHLGVPGHLLSAGLLGILAQRLVRRVCKACAVPHEHAPELLQALGAPLSLPGGRRGTGCARCRGTGLAGRVAIAELVRVTPALRELLVQGAGSDALREQARRDGSRTLWEDGLRLVAAGLTLPEEVLDVAGPAESPTPARIHTGSILPVEDTGGVPEDARPSVRLVVCDDNAVQRRVAVAALQGVVDEVLEAADGQACLDLVARVRPAALVIDHQMEGISGVEVIRKLRASLETATLPIVMLTGSSGETFEEEVFAAGADDYLTKPIAPERLRARVLAHIAARGRWSATA